MLESAAQDCLEALKLKPDLGPVIDSLAFVRLRMGKFDEAISLYSQAIEKKTGSASYMGRAIAYARKGDSVRAQADRAEALNLDGDAETRFAEYGMKF
jgi:Flp pilus assembly protein TadD